MVKCSTQESGILLHVTSLPGDYGIGEIGKEAEQFVDCLKKWVKVCGKSFHWVILEILSLHMISFPLLQGIPY